jgi:hypothetical protein
MINIKNNFHSCPNLFIRKKTAKDLIIDSFTNDLIIGTLLGDGRV